MPKLSVNIDHVATLRQSRDTPYPDPVHAALLAQQGGADGITVHPREDRRHIQDRDVHILRQVLQIPFTLEMALTAEMVDLAVQVLPEACTLVPELREERTTESGMRLCGQEARLQPLVQRLLDAGIVVSFFVDVIADEIRAAHHLGGHCIEIHTGPYALTTTRADQDREFGRVIEGAELAHSLGLQVNVGHGLHYHNTARLAAVPLIDWFHTGHSIVSHAVLVGMEQAVREMKALLAAPEQRQGWSAE